MYLMTNTNTATRILLILAALFAVGCNAPFAVWSAPGLEGDTAEAVAVWNDALAEHCPQHPGLVLVSDRDEATVSVAWGTVPGTHYGASETHDQIVVEPRLRGKRAGLLQHVIAHEIGHALGAGHDREGTLMQPVSPKNVQEAHVTARDVAQICGAPSAGGTP
jgi:hypothetical protein